MTKNQITCSSRFNFNKCTEITMNIFDSLNRLTIAADSVMDLRYFTAK